jgi:hypothetical protein
MGTDGAIGIALVDWESGLCLGTDGGGKLFDLDLAAAGNTDVVRAKMRTVESLRLNDTIEDMLVALDKQYHLIRLLRNPRNGSSLFIYLVLDRGKANLAWPVATSRASRAKSSFDIWLGQCRTPMT